MTNLISGDIYQSAEPIFARGTISFDLSISDIIDSSYFAVSFKASEEFGFYDMGDDQRVCLPRHGYAVVVRSSDFDATPSDDAFSLFKFSNWKMELLGYVLADTSLVSGVSVSIGVVGGIIKVEVSNSNVITVTDRTIPLKTGHVCFTVSEEQVTATPNSNYWELDNLSVAAGRDRSGVTY